MSKEDNNFGEEPDEADEQENRRQDESVDVGSPTESLPEPEPELSENQSRNEHGARNVAIQINANFVQHESSAPDQNSPAGIVHIYSIVYCIIVHVTVLLEP